MADEVKMQTQRKCSICGGVGHNSRGCTARPGTVAAPPASEEAVASERTLKRPQSDEDVSSESDTEQSVQRKERKRGEVNASAALRALPTCRSGWGSQCNHLPLYYAGNPWTEEEHRKFLAGLRKLGKVSNFQPVEFSTFYQ